MNKNGKHNTNIQHEILPQHNKRPHLKRIHHSWIFWIFLVLMLIGIIYYVLSDNFSLAPSLQVKQPLESSSML